MPIIAIVAVVAILGFVGFKLLTAQSGKTTATNSAAVNNQTSTASTQPSSTQANATPAQTDVYLHIKELGIKVKVSDSLKDVVYSYSPADNPQYPLYKGWATVSTQSLINKDVACKPSSSVAPLGSITKLTGDVDWRGVKLVANGSTIFKLGNSFYIMQGPQSPCATTSDAQALNISQIAAFAEAFKTVQLDN